MSSVTYRKYGPLGLSLVVALIMIAEYFLTPTSGGATNYTVTRVAADAFRQMGTVINLFSTFLAITVLSRTNLMKARTAPKMVDRFAGYEMLLLLVGSVVVGLVYSYQSSQYQTLVSYTLTAASVASIGTANIWQFYAGYRTLRVRTPESTLLMLGTLLIIFGFAAWGQIWIPGATSFATWGQLTILQPASRAIVIGSGIGAAYSSVRALAGKESTYLRSE